MPEKVGFFPRHRTRGWSRHRRRARIAGSVIAGFQLTAALASHAADWSFSPYLQAASGHESALLLDPGGAALVVPGGVFVDLAPTISLQTQVGPRGFFQLGTRARLERFFNEVNRTLYSQSLWLDYLHRFGRPTRFRISVNGNYFNDTQQTALRRLQAGAETGIGYSQRSWNVEAFVGGHAVGYPRAESFDEAGRPIDYREDRWSAGLEGAVSIVPTLRLRASALTRRTDSVLASFDSRSLLGDLSLRWSPARAWRFDAFYGMQARRFDSREAGLDEDEYQEWGLGLAYRVQPELELRVRWAAGHYRNTQGENEPTDRFEVSIDLGPAVFGVEPRSSLVLDAPEFAESIAGADPRGIRFELHAPGAGAVVLVGDFNAWDPTVHPLIPGENGHWELWLPLDPGSYQYQYLVDGVPRVPPESSTTVEDGFGGRNGLIQVLAPNS